MTRICRLVTGWRKPVSCRAGAENLTTLPVVPPTIDVIFPALNEEGALPWILERLPESYRAIVVDNGSTDNTAAVALSFGALVVQEPVAGFGAACAAGLKASTSEVIAFCDADASLNPQDLPLVCDPVIAGTADLVLGARVGSERGAFSSHARAANRFLSWRLRRDYGVRVTDLGPMRAIRREPLEGLGIRDRRFGWPLEMVIRAALEGWNIEEVSVPYYPRIGKSKVTGTVRGTAKAVKDMSQVLRSLALSRS